MKKGCERDHSKQSEPKNAPRKSGYYRGPAQSLLEHLFGIHRYSRICGVFFSSSITLWISSLASVRFFIMI